MGIPSYFAHIVRQHRSIIKQLGAIGNVDNFYLDCNSLIYDAVHSLPSPEKMSKDINMSIITSVCDKLMVYIRLVKPSQRLFIAFDGVAPMAKMNQQRKRRFGQAPNPLFNTAAITPGTAFMQQLGKEVQVRFNCALAPDLGLKQSIVSGSDECGEGEHKIYNYIRKNADYHRDSTTVVYGLDADLIMLTLHHLDIAPRMFLFRETPEFIKQLDKKLKPNTNYILDIPELADRLAAELCCPLDIKRHNVHAHVHVHAHVPKERAAPMHLIYEYVFLCFLLGNDFLPHFPALNLRSNGMTVLITAYLHVFGKRPQLTLVVNKTTVCWPNVRLLVAHLAQHELNYIKEEQKNRNKQTQRLLYSTTAVTTELTDLPLRDRRTEQYINVFEAGWEYRYYKTLFDIDLAADCTANHDKKHTLCLNYMQGLEWTLAYYGSDCPDWRWTYQYDYPPLLVDLFKFIPFQHPTVLLPRAHAGPVSSTAQLIYVLPAHARHLLPTQKAQEVAKELYSNCADDNGNGVKYQYAFCKYLWEGHMELPEVNMDTIERRLLD